MKQFSRVPLAITVSLLAVVALQSCNPGKRSKKDNAASSAFAPVYEKELTLDFPPDPSKLLEAQYALSGVADADPDFEIKGFNPSTQKELSPGVFEIPALVSTKRSDGLWDHRLVVRFRVTNESIAGMLIRVKAKKLQTGENKEPLTMETRFKLSDNAYITTHKAPESSAYGMAVLREDAFVGVKKDEATFENLMALATQGAPGVNHSANADIESVQSAWKVETRDGKKVFVQLAPAAIIVSDPGEATIETNGFPLLLQGRRLGKLSIYVGSCGRPVDAPVCKGKAGTEQNLTVIALEPPKIFAQMISEKGQIVRAVDGVVGRSPTEDEVAKLCDAQLSTIEGLPADRASCANFTKTWNGQRLELNIKLSSSDLANLELPWNMFTSHLTLKDTPDTFLLTDGKGAPCTTETCKVDFHRKDIKANPDGLPIPSPELAAKVKEDGEGTLMPAFRTGRVVAADISKSEATFDFASPTWSESVGGAREVWEMAQVRAWADEQCAAEARTQRAAWLAGAPLPEGLAGLDRPTSTTTTTIPSGEEFPRQGADTQDVDTSSLSGLWAITDTKAMTTVPASSTQGNFAVDIFVRDPLQDRVFDEQSVRVQADKLAFGGKALEMLKPLTARLEAEGYAGSDGSDTPRATIYANGDVRASVLDLTGKPGAKGASFVKTDFLPGTVEPLVYFKGTDGRTEDRASFLKNSAGEPCKGAELMAGKCSFEYLERKADVTADNATFTLAYATRPIVATYNLPWRGHTSVNGTGSLPLATPAVIGAFETILGLSTDTGTEGGSPGRDNAFAMMAAAPGRARSAGSKRDTTSVRATFWGAADAQPSNGFLKKHWKAAVTVVNPVVGIAAIVIDKGASKVKEWTDPVDAIIRDDLKNAFTSRFKSPTTGRYEVAAPDVKTLEEVTPLPCSAVPGFKSAGFVPQLAFKPTKINTRFDAMLRTDENKTYEVERPLALTSVQEKLVAAVNPVFLSSPELFRNVRTTCTPNDCYTDLDVVWKVNRERKCYDFGNRCETTERPESIAARVMWFSKQDKYLSDMVVQCNDLAKGRQEDLQAITDEINNSEARGALAGLSKLTPETRQRFAELSAFLAGDKYQNSFWEFSEVPANLRTVLASESLQGIASALRNIRPSSSARRAFDASFASKKISWVEVADSAKDLGTAKKNWTSLPTETDVRALDRDLAIIVQALRPKARALTCSMRLEGAFKHFVDSRKTTSSVLTSVEYPTVTKITFGKAMYKNVSTRLLAGQTWSLTDGTAKKIQIANPDLTPIKNEVVLKTPSSAAPGKTLEPMTAVVPTCGNVGRVAVAENAPLARFMFQDPNCR